MSDDMNLPYTVKMADMVAAFKTLLPGFDESRVFDVAVLEASEERVTATPVEIVVRYYLHDQDGKKYLVNGHPANDSFRIQVV